MKKYIALAISLSLLSACTVNPIGNTKLREQTLTSIENKIIQNKTTKQEVRELMGEPSDIKLNEWNLEEIWYYESYDEHINYTPTVMLPITLPLSILLGGNLVKPITKKENEKQLRVKIDTSTNKVTNVSTATLSKKWNY